MSRIPRFLALFLTFLLLSAAALAQSYSPVGATIAPGSGTSLVTSAGTWTFGADSAVSGNVILLNGVRPASGGSGIEMMIGPNGVLYAGNALNAWYYWNGSGWTRTLAAPTLTCAADNATPVQPNDVHGAVTRIQTYPHALPGVTGKGNILTIQPYLANQFLGAWMRNLELAGANMGEIYLETDPSSGAWPTTQGGPITTTDWNNYTSAALTPYKWMSWSQPTTGSYSNQPSLYAMTSNLFSHPGDAKLQNLTVAQRNQMIVQFLSQLETLRNTGMICGNVQFVIVDRKWFPTGDTAANRISNEVSWAETASTFINTVNTAGYGDWLAGVMLIEPQNINMSEYLPIVLDLTYRLNAATGNWLKTHLMIASGGGDGDQFGANSGDPNNPFTPISGVLCPAGTGYQFTCTQGALLPFFGLISQQTGSFAIGYKLFTLDSTLTATDYCNAYLTPPCDTASLTASKWMAYLNNSQNGLGFGALGNFIASHAATYPSHANVMFIGDSADGLYLELQTDGTTLSATPLYTAIQTLFRNNAAAGGGYTGGIFMDSYFDWDLLPSQTSPVDRGSSFFFADCSPYAVNSYVINNASTLTQSGFSSEIATDCPAGVAPNPQSQAFWADWFTLGN